MSPRWCISFHLLALVVIGRISPSKQKHLFNDSVCSEVKAEGVKTDSAYLLFYNKMITNTLGYRQVLTVLRNSYPLNWSVRR